MTLATEFAQRHHQLISDHKTHRRALRILEGEFRYKLQEEICFPPTYYFIDDSCADFINNGWDLYENTSKP